MTPSPLVVIGSSNTDMVIKMERLPRPGETVLGGEFLTAPGGKGANQAVAAARAGARVEFVARVGNDDLGTRALRNLAAAGVGVEWVTRDASAASGVALIFVAGNGENSIAVAGGANARLAPADILRARSVIAGGRLLLLQLETPLPTVQSAIELAAEAGVPVLLNPAPAVSLPDDLLQRISVLTLNETEIEILTGHTVHDAVSASRAVGQLLQRGARNVVLTLGRRGALVSTADEEHWIPACAVAAVDTTGAGDVFVGALAVALGEGQSLLSAARFANVAAAISVTRLGAQTSAPLRAEIDAWLDAVPITECPAPLQPPAADTASFSLPLVSSLAAGVAPAHPAT